MTVQDFHIEVEQLVQGIGSFGYKNVEPEELDLMANISYYEYLNDFAKFQPRGNRINDTEARLEDIQSLIVRDIPLSMVTSGGVSVASLPASFLYLVDLKVQVLTRCLSKEVTTLVPNKFYLVTSGQITVSSVTYGVGEILQVTSNTLPGSAVIVELFSRLVKPRIVSNDEANLLNDTYYGKTNKLSPIAVLAENKLQIFTLDLFFIKNAYISTINKPIAINISTPTAQIQLSEAGAHKLAKLTADNIQRTLEQRQQKIVNTKSEIK